MSESTAEPRALDDLTVRPSLPGDYDRAEPDGADEPVAPRAAAPLVLAAQAIVPGLGYLLLRKPRRAVLTLALFAMTVLIAYWQFPKDAANSGPAYAQMAVLLVLLWANLLYRTARELAERDAAGQGGVSAVRRRAAAQRQNPLRWLLALNWLVIAFLLFGINRLAIDTNVDLTLFVKSSNIAAARKLASGLFHPDWSIYGLVIRQAWVSLEMALLGTLVGASVATPLSFFAARNLMGRNPATRPVYYVMRFLLSCCRAIPTLIWGLIAVSFALSHFPGIVALGIFSFALLSKLFSEAIEAIDWGQIEAVTATGANPLQVIIFAVIPQVVPYFISHTLYALEVNIHSAVVLGLIGAGGLGLIINEFVEQLAWDKASTVLIITIAMTLTIDYSSAYIRSQLL
jgi:phosphonate transport system permease protein